MTTKGRYTITSNTSTRTIIVPSVITSEFHGARGSVGDHFSFDAASYNHIKHPTIQIPSKSVYSVFCRIRMSTVYIYKYTDIHEYMYGVALCQFVCVCCITAPAAFASFEKLLMFLSYFQFFPTV